MLPSIFGENLFDDMFDDFDRMSRAMARPLYGKRAQNLMKTDIRETDAGYELDIDLPGFKKEDIQVDLKDGYLTIQASKTSESTPEANGGRYLRQERFSGSCARSFYVGESLKPADIRAKFEDGILRLALPKPVQQPELPESTAVEII